MIAVAPPVSSLSLSVQPAEGETALSHLLETVEVPTGARCTTEESRKFLMSTGRVTKPAIATSGPSPQDIECVRQATFRHRLETGADVATAGDLMPTLERLGYA